MKKSFKRSLCVLSVAAVASIGVSAQAVLLTDGVLDVNIDNNGEFNDIFFNGTPIDNSSFVQEYFVNGTSGFSGGSAVVDGDYTASAGGFDISVTSSILGGLPSNPATTRVLEQVLIFTNNSGGALDLRPVSNIDQDIDGLGGSSAGDTVAFDVTTQSVFAVDSPLLMAAIGQTNSPGAVFGWSVDILGDEDTDFPMSNNNGPVGPDDTAMSIGFDLGSIADGQSATVTYRYLFSPDLNAVPSDFTFEQRNAVPEPITAALGLMGLGVLGMATRRRVA